MGLHVSITRWIMLNSIVAAPIERSSLPSAVLPQMSGKERALRNTLWNVVATGFAQGSTFAVNIFVARLLGKHVFGEFAMIQSTLVTAATLVQLAMGYTAAKYVAEFRSVDKERTGRILGLCGLVTVAIACVGALLLIISSPWIASELLRAPALRGALMIGSGFVLVSAINGYQIGALAGLEAYRSLAKAGIISGVVVIVGTTFAAWQWGLLGAVSALTITALLRCLIHVVFVREQLKKEDIVLRYDRLASEKQAIFGFALPAALSGYLSLPALWFGNSFLVRQSGGYEQMALYSAATNLRTLVMFLPAVVNNVGLSMLNNFMGTGNRASYRKTYLTTMTANVGTVIAVSVILLIASPPLLRLYGRDFSGGVPILAILLLAALAEVIAGTMYQVIQTYAKMWLSFTFVVLPNYLTFTTVAYFLTPIYGGRGLSTAYLAGWLVALVTISALIRFIGLNVNAGEDDHMSSPE